MPQAQNPAGPSTHQPSPGDGQLSHELVDRLYKQLKPLAARVQWRGSNPALHPSSLVHEAYLKLMRSRGLASRPDHEIIGIFAHVMRQILVDAARRNQALRRGGGAVLPLLSGNSPALEPSAGKEAVSPEEVLTLDAAMTELRDANRRQAAIISQ